MASAEEEAHADKQLARAALPALLSKFQRGPPAGTAFVWYWWHFFGRSEVFAMTLHFANVPFEFAGERPPPTLVSLQSMLLSASDLPLRAADLSLTCFASNPGGAGFTNDELDLLRPELKRLGLMPDLGTGSLPCIQIDGLTLPETLPACRYVAQTRGLYPDPSDAAAVLQVESMLTVAQHLFDKLIVYHCKTYNRKGGQTQPADEQDRRVYAGVVQNPPPRHSSLPPKQAMRKQAGHA